MLRRLLGVSALLVLAAILLAGAALGWAHLALRGLGGPLPLALTALEARDLPVSLVVADTARQPMPRSLVLDPARDPTPGAPYEMAHPAFLLRWADGRMLLVDAGMERGAAADFGRTLELAGASPLEALGSAAEQLPELAVGPLAVVFTHLHSDHTQGLGALCAARAGAPIELFQTPAQAERGNYTTRPGAAAIRAAECVRPRRLPDGEPLAALPGYPGVGVVWAAGHTPGSQLVLAALRGPDSAVRRIAFAGDVANAVDGIRRDVPKPLLYRLLVVPEDEARLSEVRRFLRHLEQAGVSLAPSHDAFHLRSLGLAFASDRTGAAAPRGAPSPQVPQPAPATEPAG
jgi:glyoxylase-like metal-dependent hydrolase (beta-lactamase superfamily II)